MQRSPTIAALVAVGVIAGCSATTAGRAVKALPPMVEQALPDPGQLSRALGGLKVDNHSEVSVGGLGALRDDKDTSAPARCAGMTHAGYLPSYRGAPVRAVSRSVWETVPGATSTGSIILVIAVVELDTARDAQTWYTKMVSGWVGCAHTEMTESYSNMVFVQQVDSVHDSGHVLSAELTVTTEDGLVTPQTNRRAVALKSRFLVDVEGLVTKGDSAAARFDPTTIAHLVTEQLP